MKLTVISSANMPSHNIQYSGNTQYTNNTEFAADRAKTNNDAAKVKAASLIGSAATTLIYLFVMAKHAKKGDFKLKDLFNVDFQNMFKVMGLATSAVIGGLTGGLITDKKENRKPKLKEAIHQFLGNIVTPITIVGIAAKQIEKRKFPVTKEILFSSLAAVAGVTAGVTGGNYIASKVNKAIFKENDDRKLGVKDFGIHVDDLLTVAALTPSGEKIKGFTSKALPAIFLICGYEAGTKRAADVENNLVENKLETKA